MSKILIRIGFVILLIALWRGDVVGLSGNHCEWEKSVFRGAYELIATREEWQVLDTLHPSHLKKYLDLFWKRRDPSPATEINEFKAQFEERVEFALTRLRSVNLGRPWDDRGDIYIKLGPPDDSQDHVDFWYAPFDTLRLRHLRRYSNDPSRDVTEDPNIHKRDYGEMWYYFGRNLTLQFQSNGVEYELVPVVSFVGEYQPLRDFAEVVNRVETTSVAYELPTGVADVSPALDCYPFRRTDGMYDVYLASAAPLRALADFTDWRGGDVNYTAHVIAFDSTLKVQWHDSVRVEQHFEVLPRGMLAQNQWATVLKPGFYIMTAEIRDVGGKKHGVGSFDRWLVPYLDSVELDLSPLVVAADIRDEGDTSGTFVRNGKEIVPMPGRVFRKDQHVSFYHEVYNLHPGHSGLCRYRIEYTLYDRKKGSKRTLLSKDFESQERQTFQAGRIPERLLSKGSFTLEAKTTDLNAVMTKTALAQFKVE